MVIGAKMPLRLNFGDFRGEVDRLAIVPAYLKFY
jgi:hypothetical protein